jgi:hypothetical protein
MSKDVEWFPWVFGWSRIIPSTLFGTWILSKLEKGRN